MDNQVNELWVAGFRRLVCSMRVIYRFTCNHFKVSCNKTVLLLFLDTVGNDENIQIRIWNITTITHKLVIFRLPAYFELYTLYYREREKTLFTKMCPNIWIVGVNVKDYIDYSNLLIRSERVVSSVRIARATLVWYHSIHCTYYILVWLSASGLIMFAIFLGT